MERGFNWSGGLSSCKLPLQQAAWKTMTRLQREYFKIEWIDPKRQQTTHWAAELVREIINRENS